jgi:hypothetical protein
MKILLCLLLVLTSISVRSAEIEGAFGLKFNAYNEIKTKQYKKVKFIPEAGLEFLMFQDYFYSVTPKTNKIYSITAEGSVINNCQKDLGIINKIIKDKYSIQSSKKESQIKYEKEEKIVYDFMITYSFRSNDKQILLTCDPEYETIIITYMDILAVTNALKESESVLNKEIKTEIQKLKKEDKYKTNGF